MEDTTGFNAPLSTSTTRNDVTRHDIPCDPGGFVYDGDLFTTGGVPTPEEQANPRIPLGPDSMPSRYGSVAQRYWEAGWQPLPLPPGAKFPPPSGYTGKTAYEKKLTVEQVTDWIARQSIGNIGLRMPFKVVALDVDAYAKGATKKRGDETFSQLIEQYGPLPPTVSSSARPGVGGQFFYRLPDLGQPVILPGVPGPGVEAIQHHHRYSVVWPSRNPDAGGAVYQWRLPDPSYTGDDWWKHWVDPKDEWFIPSVDSLPELPEAWCHITPIGGKDVTRGVSEAPLGSKQILDALESWQRDADLDPRLADQILNRYVTSVSRGEARHDSCMSALTWACKAGEAGLINTVTVVDTLHSMFAADTNDRFIHGEFESMLGWAAAQGQRDGATYRAEWDRSREQWMAERGMNSSLPSEATNLWAGQETEDNMVEIPDPREPKADGGETSKTEDLCPSIDWDELFAQDFSQIDWLPGKICERGQQVALVGGGKVGKTMFVYDWLYRCVTGKRFLGDEPREPLKVLYFDRENSRRDLVTRMKALGATPDELRERFVYKLHPRFSGGLDQAAVAVAELFLIIDQEKPDVVVFDTVSRFIGGKENDSDTWLAFYRMVHFPLKQRGIAGIRLDHMGKDEGRGSRGSSAKSQDVDHVWEMNKVDETHAVEGYKDVVSTVITLARTHTRTGLGPDDLNVVRRGVKLGDVWAEGQTRHQVADKDAVKDAKQGINNHVQALLDVGVPKGLGRDKLKLWAKEHGVDLPSNNGVVSNIVKALGHAHNEIEASKRS